MMSVYLFIVAMNGPMDAAGQNQGVNAMHRNMGMDSFLQQGTGRMPGPSMPTVNTNSILGMDNMSNPSLATQGSVFDSMLNATQSQVPTQQTMTIGNQARTMVDPVDHSETLLKVNFSHFLSHAYNNLILNSS